MKNFVVVEGLSGSGKSTISDKIISYLQKENIPCIYNHGACTDTDFGYTLKSYMKKNKIDYKTANQVTSYFIADIVQDTINNIKPNLEKVTVVQDRYIDSIISYYNFVGKITNQDLDIMEVMNLYQQLDLLLNPAINILCIAEPKIILERLINRTETGKVSSIHKQYIDNPSLIELHQNEFLTLHNSRMNTNKIIINTSYDQINEEFLFDFLKINLRERVCNETKLG